MGRCPAHHLAAAPGAAPSQGSAAAWFLRLGLFVYDYLGGRKLLPGTKTLDMRTDEAAKPLKPIYTKAFEFSDCWVNDARLVVLNARDAADRGATIVTRATVTSARKEDGAWAVQLRHASGETETVRAKLLVNASGPWVDEVLSGTLSQNRVGNVRLVQGSHIVVNRLYEHDRCYFFQNGDGRIMFVIPYEDEYSLIGTTDLDYVGNPGEVKISESEIDYLLASSSEYFAKPVTRADIVWSYSGVRPLYADGASKAQEATRDYVIKTSGKTDDAPLVNVIGGKLTTYRRLAESVLEKVEDLIGKKGVPWTHAATLPGGDFPPNGYDDVVAALKRDYAFLDLSYARRLVRLYGTLARKILGVATELRRAWPSFRRRPLRGRGPLPDGSGMGQDQRRRAVAPHQTRASRRTHRRGRARCLHGRDKAGAGASPRLSRAFTRRRSPVRALRGDGLRAAQSAELEEFRGSRGDCVLASMSSLRRQGSWPQRQRRPIARPLPSQG